MPITRNRAIEDWQNQQIRQELLKMIPRMNRMLERLDGVLKRLEDERALAREAQA